jgi:hypothetical protein
MYRVRMTNTLVISIGVLVMETKSGARWPRQTKAQAVLIGCVSIGAVTGFVWGFLEGLDRPLPMPVQLTVAAVLLVVGAGASIYYWRLIDEAAREAHKFAWFWGGSTALILALPTLFFIDASIWEALLGAHDTRYWVMAGVQAVVLIQLAGYVLAWVGWWLFRSR